MQCISQKHSKRLLLTFSDFAPQVLVVAFDMVCYRALGYLLKLLCIDTWLYFLCASDFPSTNQENVLRFSKSFSLWDLHSATFMGSRRKARDLKIWNIPCNAELGKHINFIIREQLCFDSWKSNMEVLKQRNMVFSMFRPLTQTEFLFCEGYTSRVPPSDCITIFQLTRIWFIPKDFDGHLSPLKGTSPSPPNSFVPRKRLEFLCNIWSKPFSIHWWFFTQ